MTERLSPWLDTNVTHSHNEIPTTNTAIRHVFKLQTWETVRPPDHQGKWYVLFERLSSSKSNPGEKN